MVKVGLGPSINRPAPGQSLTGYIEEALAVVRAAREAGFHYIRCGHHWLAGFLDPFAMLARAVPESGGMDLHTGVFLLPLHNPFDIAERVATLDVLSNGRVKLGVGLGYRDDEFEMAGVAKRERVGRLEESIDLLRRLWSGEEVTHQGRHFSATKVRSPIKPVQQPGPPIYVGGTHPNAVRRAGRIGDGWVAMAVYTRADFAGHVSLYREARGESGRQGPGEVQLNRHVHIANTRAEAMREAETYLPNVWKTDFYRQGGLEQDLGGAITFDLTWEELATERAVIGTADDVAEGLARYVDDFGVTQLTLSFQTPGMPHGDYLAAIRLVGEQVLPQLG